MKEEAEKVRKKNIAKFSGKSKVMKDNCCLWDGWLDRADDHVESIRRRCSSDDFTVDYKSFQYKVSSAEVHENGAKSDEKELKIMKVLQSGLKSNEKVLETDMKCVTNNEKSPEATIDTVEGESGNESQEENGEATGSQTSESEEESDGSRSTVVTRKDVGGEMLLKQKEATKSLLMIGKSSLR